jgi:hypothetical protein
MKRPAAVFTIALALGAISLAPLAGARAGEPFEIEKCQTISQPGSYKLVKNISPTSSTSTNGTCLVITASFVSINLGGFTITGFGGTGTFGIVATPSSGQLQGIALRSGSIVGNGVELSAADGSIVEGLGVFGLPGATGVGIDATGIVKNNTVVGIVQTKGVGIGISASGTVTGNYVTGSDNGMSIGQGSTVLGNTSTNNGTPQLPASGTGISVGCPSNVTDNTAVNNSTANIVLNGTGCNDTNNVAP